METLFKFDNLVFVHFFWILIALALLLGFLLRRKKELLIRFTSLNNLSHIAKNVSFPREILKTILLLIGMAFVIFAVMRPLGNPEEKVIKVKGRDIVFVLDVSKSMLAEDEGMGINRLERSKLAIRDIVDILEGDRVALVAFAGSTVLKSPLTNDYNFFKTVLRRTSTRDINRGGTLIGDAIRFVEKNILEGSPEDEIRYKDIILITDGEDQESFPIEAAKSITDKGIRIHTVGIGSLKGTKIPIRDEEGNITGFIREGEDTNIAHRSVLNEDVLKRIALITNGVYIPARTNAFYLDELYNEAIVTQEQKEREKVTRKRWSELYQNFLLPGIILLAISFFIPSRRRNK
ncbi:MAG: VWA domain-containing protein [Spirochaetota bacterium]